MSDRVKKAIQICTMLLFVLPYRITREVGSNGDEIITVRALLWEIETGKKGGLPHLRVRCPEILEKLLKS